MVDRIEQTYIRRFGSMRQAYALIGYKEFRNMPAVRETKLRTRKTLRAVFRQILRTFKGQVEAIQERGGNQQALRFHDGVKVSVSICRCVDYGFGLKWVIPVTVSYTHLEPSKSNRSILSPARILEPTLPKS